MKTLRLALTIALALVFGTTELALAGAPGSGGRADDLDFVCEGGTSDGASCTTDDDCPHGGTCELETDGTKMHPFVMTATIIIDDDTSEWNEDEEEEDVHSVTVLLEFVARGRRRLLAQTYMNLKGIDADDFIANMKQGVEIADLPNSERRLDEALGIAAVLDDGINDDFLFQRGDRRIENKMRRYFRTDGNFVVSKTKRIRAYSDHVGGGLASVIQAKLDVVITPAEE